MTQENATTRYIKKTLIQKVVRFNRNTDKELIAHIDKIENFQGYIKDLIQRDIDSKKQ